MRFAIKMIYLLSKSPESMSTTMGDSILFLLFVNTFLSLSSAEDQNPMNYLYLPPVKNEFYSQLGDINIGEVVNIYGQRAGSQTCDDEIRRDSEIPENTIPLKFAVDLINRNPKLLPNVTLGFVLHAGCGTISMKLASSLLFLPRSERICNGTGCYIQQMKSKSDSQYIHHDVIGMLAPANSDKAVALSYLFSGARMPMMGFMAESNELSFQDVHPYFLRVNTLFRYQIRGILKFSSENGWTYIQMIYRDVGLGWEAYKFMHKEASNYGICIAGSHMLENDNYGQITRALQRTPRARVVVLFIQPSEWPHLLNAIHQQNESHYFIWIASSLTEGHTSIHHTHLSTDLGVGTLTVYPFTSFIPEYYDYVRNIDVNTTENPWLKRSWEYFQNCSYSKGTCKSNVDVLESPRYVPMKYTSLKVDAVLAFAHAAHQLLKNQCPKARGKEARACINGPLIREYLLKLKFTGYTGYKRFGVGLTMRGNITFRQLKYGYSKDTLKPTNEKRIYEKVVANYDASLHNIHLFKNGMTWSHLKQVKRIVPRDKGSTFYDIPESVCSRPCIVGEYKIEKDVPCCWDCLRCRDNERLIEGNTGCEACPLITWPDPMSDFTTCIDIPPTYQTMQDTMPIVLISVATFAIILTIFIFSAYIKYRNERVVKASSRELSIIQLVGIVTGYTTVIIFQTKPTHTMCRTIFFMFCMSFALLYCPLLVKTLTSLYTYRRAVNTIRPRFTGTLSQLIVSFSLIAIQLLLCGGVIILIMPGARRTQPIWSEKMVELSCDFTLPGIAFFLGYNIFLVCLCFVFTFMVRKTADNYNESRFISMCVSTTLLIWMAFIPTYFTAGREYIRMFLLCMALILNHSVVLTLLFLPKLYTAKFVCEGALHLEMKQSKINNS